MFGQQRSNSGPGGLGLSINTNTANSFNPSSNVSQAPQSGGLFGPKPSLFGSTATAPQAGTLFGAGVPTVQTPTVFGAATTTASQAGTLFGTSAAKPAGGLFGSQSTGTPQQQSSRLFGDTATPQPQAPAGGLFGSSTAQPRLQQEGGLFGSLGQGQQQQQQQQQQPRQQGLGLFGQSQQQQNKGSFFGGLPGGNTVNLSQPQIQQRPNFPSQSFTMAPPQQTQRSLFSSSIGQYSQQQQMVPGVRVDLTNLRGTTRFSDLHEDLQKVVESIDTFIHSQIQLADECEQAMPKIGDYLAYIPRDVELDMRLLDAVERALENHADVIEEVKKGKNGDVADARAIFKAIHNLRVPQQFQHSSLWHVPAATSVDPSAAEADGAADLVGYIGKRADETAARLAVFAARTGEVESYLRGMEAETLQQAQRAQFARGRDGARSAEDQVRELAAVLKEFEGGILGIAGRVGALREEVVALELGGNGRRAR